MIKKTLYFGNPAYLALRNDQLVIKLPEIEKNDSLLDTFRQQSQVTKPIEDIGVVVLDNKQITITSGALEALLENNCAVITCDSKSMPVGLLLPLYGNTTQNERFRQQLSASVPLMKQLWQQTIKAKIYNQASLLDACTNEENKCMKIWATEVKSGDSDNLEARAAAYYWKRLFPIEGFTRDRNGMPPNNLLNYGYAILYTRCWQALLAAQLNPYDSVIHARQPGQPTFAFDFIEIFRAQAVDRVVISLIQKNEPLSITDGKLSKESKALLIRNISERLYKPEKFRKENMNLAKIIKVQASEIAGYFNDGNKFKPYKAKW